MKRTISVLTVAAGVLGVTLTGAGPALADTSAVDCSTGGYTYVVNKYVPTNVESPAVDNRLYNIAGPTAYTHEVCLDIPDNETFTIEVRIGPTGSQQVIVDDRPGDKIFRFSPGTNTFWQVYGTLTGPGSTYLYYTWHEKQIPA
ncbi:hypothetical protein OHB01_00120 [Microbispora hainanensis]|jgi:hypothetical protein|uniref:Streptomyces killer toxin-like beta/gamma crystallin domain-containing protein n=1 Tax=Microbispora hainanensis TaxID=568844 RepID=A0ABZ1SR28_9ACTN|nr:MULTISPECIES: hypothetical protein [Microbispora]NJP27753.1 hypothetical protein [Microbispora sp. CL1-1]TQS10755.1 hypothetical protein FLW53_26780 [Microbispora sp. SCL1-1]